MQNWRSLWVAVRKLWSACLFSRIYLASWIFAARHISAWGRNDDICWLILWDTPCCQYLKHYCWLCSCWRHASAHFLVRCISYKASVFSCSQKNLVLLTHTLVSAPDFWWRRRWRWNWNWRWSQWWWQRGPTFVVCVRSLSSWKTGLSRQVGKRTPRPFRPTQVITNIVWWCRLKKCAGISAKNSLSWAVIGWQWCAMYSFVWKKQSVWYRIYESCVSCFLSSLPPPEIRYLLDV